MRKWTIDFDLDTSIDERKPDHCPRAHRMFFTDRQHGRGREAGGKIGDLFVPGVGNIEDVAWLHLFRRNPSPNKHRPVLHGLASEEALQEVPHFARVHVLNLKTGTEILRVRRNAEASFMFAGEKPVSDPETLTAMKRQVNNCALAKAVEAAIKAPAP